MIFGGHPVWKKSLQEKDFKSFIYTTKKEHFFVVNFRKIFSDWQVMRGC